MIVNEKRRQKINVFKPAKVQRMSKMLQSITMKLCDPDKITSSPDEVVNKMDNMNRMQRLSVGVYMYDRAAAMAVQSEQIQEQRQEQRQEQEQEREDDKTE